MARKKREINLDTFYTIRLWMPLELGLKGAELLVYACMYAYCVSGKGYYYGGYDLISKSTGYSTKQVARALNALVNKKLLDFKQASLASGLKRNLYRVSMEPLTKINSVDIQEDLKELEATGESWINCFKDKEDEDYVSVDDIF